MGLGALLWTVAVLLGTACLALAAAENARPRDDQMMGPKPLNRMLTAFCGWTSLALVGVMALYKFGLVRPALGAIILYGLYRLALTRDLGALYPYNVAFAICALLAAILVIATALPQRITP